MIKPFQNMKYRDIDFVNIPITITVAYPILKYVIALDFYMYLILVIGITLYKYNSYNMLNTYNGLIIVLLLVPLITNTIYPIWILIYLYPTIKFLKNNLVYGLVEILIDIFCIIIL